MDVWTYTYRVIRTKNMIIIYSEYSVVVHFISVWKLKLDELKEKGGSVYALDQVAVTLCRIHFPSMILVHCSHIQNKFRTIIKNVPESASPHGLHGNICSLLKTHPDLL